MFLDTMEAAWHRGSVRTSHPEAPGSNHSSAMFLREFLSSLMLTSWTVENENRTHLVLMQRISQMQCSKGLSKALQKSIVSLVKDILKKDLHIGIRTRLHPMSQIFSCTLRLFLLHPRIDRLDEAMRLTDLRERQPSSISQQTKHHFITSSQK